MIHSDCCCICLSPPPSETSACPHCGHNFCPPCLAHWLHTTPTPHCPHCRAPLAFSPFAALTTLPPSATFHLALLAALTSWLSHQRAIYTAALTHASPPCASVGRQAVGSIDELLGLCERIEAGAGVDVFCGRVPEMVTAFAELFRFMDKAFEEDRVSRVVAVGR